MLLIYERADLGTMIHVATAKDRYYRELFEALRKYKPVRETPYYELFRESPIGRTFICSGFGNSHKEALNVLIDKFYKRKGN
jgi:hypothetical protein